MSDPAHQKTKLGGTCRPARKTCSTVRDKKEGETKETFPAHLAPHGKTPTKTSSSIAWEGNELGKKKRTPNKEPITQK